jgi:hypothetical protein
MLRILALAACSLIAAAAAPMAVADTPQGQINGNMNVAGVLEFISFSGGSSVVDGGTSFVGQSNDLSGNCAGDSGTVTVGFSGASFNIVCSHFVLSSGCCNAGSPKMRFAYQNVLGTYTVIRITDNGSPGTGDTLGWGTTPTLADAIAWVNTGVVGAGHPFTFWSFVALSNGNFTVQP